MIIIKTISPQEETDIVGWAESRQDAKVYLYNEGWRFNESRRLYEDGFGFVAQIENVPSVYDA